MNAPFSQQGDKVLAILSALIDSLLEQNDATDVFFDAWSREEEFTVRLPV